MMGSQLLRPDGSEAWLNLGNTLGHHDLSLPRKLPFPRSRDDLHPGFLVGTDNILPRAFGFTEYADLLDLFDSTGYSPGTGKGLRYAVYTYDWRRDLVEGARGLGLRLEGLAREMGDPGARFHLVGHSMGGLVARYYLRFGGAEPAADARVTWAGARRAASVLLAATPNAGSIPPLLLGMPGPHTTLAASVVSRMPSVYQLLPPSGTQPLVDPRGRPLEHDLHDPATWERFRWGLAPLRTIAGRSRRSSSPRWSARARSTALARPRNAVSIPVRHRQRLPAHPRPRGRRQARPAPHGWRPHAAGDILYGRATGASRARPVASHLPGRGLSLEQRLVEVAVVLRRRRPPRAVLRPALQNLLLRLLLRPGPGPGIRPRSPEPAAALPS
jgi:hypothetical protein